MPLALAVNPTPANELTLTVKEKHVKKVSLAIRKTLDGNLIVQDHHTINIVIMPEKGKILAFPKGEFTQDCYTDQDQLFQYLVSSGVVAPETVIGGNIYGSLEATFNKEKR